MRYPLTALALWLQDVPHFALEDVDDMVGAASFTNVYWCPGGGIPCPEQEGCLYTGEPDTIHALAERMPNAHFLTTGRGEKLRVSADGRIIYLPGSDSYGAYQSLWRAFDEINQWLLALDEATVTDRGLQELLDISQPILQNPIIIFDAEFNVKASSRTISKEDYRLYEMVQEGRAAPRTVLNMQQIDKKSDQLLGEKFFYSETNQVCGLDEYFIPLYTSSRLLVARVSVRCKLLRSCTGNRWLLTEFCKRIVTLLSRRETENVYHETKDFLFRQLIEGEIDPEQMARTIGIPPTGEFQVLCPVLPSREDAEKIKNIAHIIGQLLPMSHVFLYQRHFFILLGTATKNRDYAEFWAYQQEQAVCMCQTLDIHVGVSNTFTDLKGLKLYCQQALVARGLIPYIQSGRLSFCPPTGETDPTCYPYASLSAYHMVLQLMKGLLRELIGDPAYWKMLADEERTGANNCQVLLCYLKNGCRANLAAKELFMHRNSVVYRIDRLAESYSLDLEDPHRRFMLLLAGLSHELEDLGVLEDLEAMECLTL